jgi:hypothetical protein
MARLYDIKRFYASLNRLRLKRRGYQSLSPEAPLPAIPSVGGVYFFFERGEVRSQSGHSPRVVRVGKATNLRARLYAHHGALTLTGPTTSGWHPHFHWYVQEALDAKRTGMGPWKSKAEAASAVIAAMRFLWLPVVDPVVRRHVEDHTVRLLSNYERAPIDPASPEWLGRRALKEEIRSSHLWNVQGVKAHLRGRDHDPTFLDTLAALVESV